VGLQEKTPSFAWVLGAGATGVSVPEQLRSCKCLRDGQPQQALAQSIRM